MNQTITVSGRVIGKKKPLFTDWSVTIPPDHNQAGRNLTLRDLITLVVTKEVSQFQQRQSERRFNKILSTAEIEVGAVKGKIDSGGRNLDQSVTLDDAITTALQAFEDGLYLVFLDGKPEKDLDKEVTLQPDSQLMFVRLVLLAGG